MYVQKYAHDDLQRTENTFEAYTNRAETTDILSLWMCVFARVRVECKCTHSDLDLQSFLGHLKFLTYLVMLFLELLSAARQA